MRVYNGSGSQCESGPGALTAGSHSETWTEVSLEWRLRPLRYISPFIVMEGCLASVSKQEAVLLMNLVNVQAAEVWLPTDDGARRAEGNLSCKATIQA